MRRFLLLLRNEFKMFRTALAVHLIAVFQPTIMFLLMSVIMVFPTFDMYIAKTETGEVQTLVAAMESVGSPIGPDYINPILVSDPDPGHRQVIEIVKVGGKTTALQKYGYIDSNLVKNLRNRLTTALLILWNQRLGIQAVTINEHPLMPEDVPYTVYFGMAMIPLATYLAAVMIGGYLVAQDFEHGTILEYRICPAPFPLVLGAKLTRLLLTGLAASMISYTALGLVTGVWVNLVLPVILPLILLAIIAGCMGLLAGLLTRSTLPSFLVGLASAFAFWLLGSGFGLAAGFSPVFERVSRLIPNTPVIEMLFPYFFFGWKVAANPTAAKLQLAGYCLALLAAVVLVYRRQVLTLKS